MLLWWWWINIWVINSFKIIWDNLNIHRRARIWDDTKISLKEKKIL